MMKKILRTILRAIPVVLVLVFCLSVTAMAYSGSESVTLKTTQNEATSGSLSCHHAKVSATNSASSQHNVSAALQLSSGSGWSNYGTFTLAPAASGNTGLGDTATMSTFAEQNFGFPVCRLADAAQLER